MGIETLIQMALAVVLVCYLCYYKYSNDNTANYYAVFIWLLIKERVMEKKYELVTFDSGHEYTKPCQLLMETESSWFVGVIGGGETLVSKVHGYMKLREVKEKVDVYALLSATALAVDKELVEGEVKGLGEAWVKLFGEKLIKAGALKVGLYEE